MKALTTEPECVLNSIHPDWRRPINLRFYQIIKGHRQVKNKFKSEDFNYYASSISMEGWAHKTLKHLHMLRVEQYNKEITAV